MPKGITCICTILVILGGLNWGLVGIFDFNFINYIFSGHMIFAKISYIIIGIASLWMLVSGWNCCKSKCKK